MQQIVTQNAVTMSSREIAQLTGKEHKHVMRDIRAMLQELELDESNFGRIYLDLLNREQTEFLLDRELTETLLTGYSIPLRRKVIARLHELESGQTFAIPTTLSAALRLAADQQDVIEAQTAQLALAAPKAAFVDQYVEASGSMSFRQVAKLINANERTFRQMLLDKGVMYYLGGVLTPYSQHQDAGRFEVKTGTSETNGHAFSQARFTAKGVQWIAGIWAAYQIEVAA